MGNSLSKLFSFICHRVWQRWQPRRSPLVHADFSAGRLHPAAPAHVPAPRALQGSRFLLFPPRGLGPYFPSSSNFTRNSSALLRDLPPLAWSPPSRKKPVLRHFAREGPVKIPPPSLTFPLRLPPLQMPAPILKTAVRAEDGEEPMEVDNQVEILKTAVRAEEGEEPMEVDDQGLGVPSAPTPAGGVLPFGKPDPAPAALPGPVPGCSHWPDKAASLVLGKDHQPSSSAKPMEWEATQHKDPPAVATKGPSKPRAASRSSRQPKWLVQPQQLRLVPPQQWRWGRNEGPPPAKRPRRSVKGFMDTGKSSRTTSSRRLKKKHGKKLQ
ncbi:putative UPF0607 protein ENSP00000381514 [Callithrix jacchus]